MTPDDPRHGEARGYIAGCRDACCRVPRNRQLKRREIEVLHGVPAFRSREDFETLLAPWLRLGLSATAVCEAAGVKTRQGGESRGPVRVATYDAVAAVTEADLKPTAMVYADLTCRRAFSLMAAGHKQQDLPVAANGLWRARLRIRVDLARSMRDYYEQHEAHPGQSAYTRARALNAGHLPPAAWDDPGTLAWPSGQPEPILQSSGTLQLADIDHAVVERVLAGEVLPTTTAERREITRRWLVGGGSEKALCDRMNWRAGRYTPERGVA